jgi:hypothetical protein
MTRIKFKLDLFSIGWRWSRDTVSFRTLILSLRDHLLLIGLGVLSLANIRSLISSYFLGLRAIKGTGKVDAPVDLWVQGVSHFVTLFEFLWSLQLAILFTTEFIKMWPFTQETSLALLTSCEIPHFLAEIAHLVFQLLLLISKLTIIMCSILKGWRRRVFRRALQDIA